jgi:hypothetical protein
MSSAYIFTKKGRVQFFVQDNKEGMIIAPTRKLADQFVAWYQRAHGVRLTVAKVGSVQGETLGIQLEAASERGANCAFLLNRVDDDGVSADVMTRGGGPVR